MLCMLQPKETNQFLSTISRKREWTWEPKIAEEALHYTGSVILSQKLLFATS